MCGIAGQFNYLDGVPVDVEHVTLMSRALTHRGPDAGGIYADGSVVLAHRRLSIVDVAGGQQPMPNEDQSVWVVFNGEIYNFAALQRTLQQEGHRFATRSDTEVLVHGYEQRGVASLDNLNGIFAYALWDVRKRRLLLARDRFGVKPLYVWDANGRIVFSSELKAFLLHPDFVPEIDTHALQQYLTYQFVPSPRTMLRGVSKIRPGHYITVDAAGVHHGRFALDSTPTLGSITEADAAMELERLLTQAVSRQMMSDVPVGALLSGGVDSAAVVALMRQSSGARVRTYTVGFEGDFVQNELTQARRTAHLLGTDHADITLSRDDFFSTLDRIVWHLDEPIGTPSALAMYAVCARAAEDVKVVLTGQGADEPWAGYRRYRGEQIGEVYRKVPPSLRHLIIEPLVERLPRAEVLKRSIKSLGSNSALDRFVGLYTTFGHESRNRLLNGAVTADDQDTREAVAYWLADVEGQPPLMQQLYVETRFSLADNLLMYGDKMSMAHSLEARVPLLDNDLMAFVERLPLGLRLKGWSQHKYLLKRVVAKWLPDEILSRPKIGFATPVDRWLRSDGGALLREHVEGSRELSRFVDASFVRTLIDQHLLLRHDNTRQLYSLLMLSVWLKSFLDPASALERFGADVGAKDALAASAMSGGSISLQTHIR